MRPEHEKQKAELEKLLGVPPPPAPRIEPHFVRNRDVMLRFLEGQTPANIAADLGLEVKQIRAILKKQPIKREIQRLAGLANDRYIQERVDTLTIEALDVVRDTMRGVNFNELRFKAAKELLDKNPLLKQSGASDEAKAIGVGLGEAIINRLAQIDSQAQKKEIDITPEQEKHEGA